MTGHPRHQVREFKVTVSVGFTGDGETVRVKAQTERDAILRAGVMLGRRGVGVYTPVVTGVDDPAPQIWNPEVRDQPAPFRGNSEWRDGRA